MMRSLLLLFFVVSSSTALSENCFSFNYNCRFDTNNIKAIQHGEFSRDRSEQLADCRYYASGPCRIWCECRVPINQSNTCYAYWNNNGSAMPTTPSVCPSDSAYKTVIVDNTTASGIGNTLEEAWNKAKRDCTDRDLYILPGTNQSAPLDCSKSCADALKNNPPPFLNGGLWQDESGAVNFPQTCCYSCSAPKQMCNGVCTSTDGDPLNCGACGKVCGQNSYCGAGTCRCDSGSTAMCNGKCCDSDSSCVSGVCVNCTYSGKTQCGGKCVFTTSDPNNCGGCGKVCPAGMICSSSQCKCPPT